VWQGLVSQLASTLDRHLVAQIVLVEEENKNLQEAWRRTVEEEQLRKEVEEENKNLQETWRMTVEEENKRSLELIKQQLKQAIKLELSQIASQHSPPLEPPDIQVVVAGVSTKGSCAEAYTIPLAKKPSDLHIDIMGLYVVHDQCTKLVALGKVYDSAFTIHNIPYADDVVRVSVVKVYHGDAYGSPLQLLFVHLYLKEISMGVYRKAHQIVKYLKLKRMNPSIEHRELMLAKIKFRIEALLIEHV